MASTRQKGTSLWWTHPGRNTKSEMLIMYPRGSFFGEQICSGMAQISANDNMARWVEIHWVEIPMNAHAPTALNLSFDLSNGLSVIPKWIVSAAWVDICYRHACIETHINYQCLKFYHTPTTGTLHTECGKKNAGETEGSYLSAVMIDPQTALC